LDDPFAPLDSQKIAEILENLQRHFGEATWIVFTHRQEARPYLDRWWEEVLRGEASILQREG